MSEQSATCFEWRYTPRPDRDFLEVHRPFLAVYLVIRLHNIFFPLLSIDSICVGSKSSRSGADEYLTSNV